MYAILKFAHILGVVLLIGNVTVSAVWKVFADRTRDVSVIAFAQRLVTATDWTLTLSGIALIIVGGYGMAAIGGQDLLTERWLVEGQALFAISGLIWLLVLIPAQIRLARVARRLGSDAALSLRFLRDGRLWLWWGIAATIPLVAAVYVMVAKG